MLDDHIACQERHERFVRRVLVAGEVWGLKGPNGFCSVRSNVSERDVIPFWSDRAYAKQCAREEWSDFAPVAIPLAEYISRWLPGMHRDGVLAGTNWSVQLIGLEIEPSALKQQLETAGSLPT